MLDTLRLARELKVAGVEPQQADAIAHVVQQAVEHAGPATRGGPRHALRRRAGDIAALEARLIKWMIGIALSVAGMVVVAGTAFAVAFLPSPE